ncbi:MAG: glutathione S-transferase family protein [Pseudomonadota bacterium]
MDDRLALYEYPPTRSNRVKWALEELDIAYESVIVDLAAGAQNKPDYRSLHPLGRVPAVRSAHYSLFESVAIVMQLFDEHPDKGFAPEVGTADRAAYYQWCVFAAAELDPAIMTVFDNAMRPLAAMRPPGRQHDPVAAQYGRVAFDECAQALTAALGDGPYVLGERFSGADIAVGHSCDMARRVGLIDEFPVLLAYLDRLGARPAHQRVYARAT